MNLTTLTSRGAATVVAGVAGVISYGHIRSVAGRVGESDLAGWLLPLSVDGLVVVGTMAVLEDRRQQRQPRLSARVAIVAGVLATVAFNIASAAPSWGARAVAATPAVSFLIAVEVLARAGRRQDSGEKTSADLHSQYERQHQAPRAETVDKTPPSRRVGGRPSARDRVAQAVAHAPNATDAEIADRLRLSVRTVRRHRPAVDKTPAQVGR